MKSLLRKKNIGNYFRLGEFKISSNAEVFLVLLLSSTITNQIQVNDCIMMASIKRKLFLRPKDLHENKIPSFVPRLGNRNLSLQIIHLAGQKQTSR